MVEQEVESVRQVANEFLQIKLFYLKTIRGHGGHKSLVLSATSHVVSTEIRAWTINTSGLFDAEDDAVNRTIEKRLSATRVALQVPRRGRPL